MRRGILLSLFDSTQPPPTQISTRIIIAGLLTTHPTTRSPQLRAKTTLPTLQPWRQPQAHKIVTLSER